MPTNWNGLKLADTGRTRLVRLGPTDEFLRIRESELHAYKPPIIKKNNRLRPFSGSNGGIKGS